jgi:hypothetical protein
LEADESGGDLRGSGSVGRNAEVGSSSGSAYPGRDVQQSVAQPLRLSLGVVAVEEHHAGPGEQVGGDEDQFQPGGVDGELLRTGATTFVGLPKGAFKMTRGRATLSGVTVLAG